MSPMCHSAKLSADYFKPIAAFFFYYYHYCYHHYHYYHANNWCQLITYNWARAAIRVRARASRSDNYCHWALPHLFSPTPPQWMRLWWLKGKKINKERKERKKDRRKPFLKTMPHHRKPCTHGTNTPPCFIAAVSSHWCSHREICLDAFAGSDAKNSRCQRAEYVVVGSCFFFFFLPLFLSSVYLPISCVQEAGMRFIFTFRWKDTHQGRHTSPATSRAFESIAVDKS